MIINLMFIAIRFGTFKKACCDAILEGSGAFLENSIDQCTDWLMCSRMATDVCKEPRHGATIERSSRLADPAACCVKDIGRGGHAALRHQGPWECP